MNIDCIFIFSHSKEILNKRFNTFIKKLKTNLPIILFINEYANNYVDVMSSVLDMNIEIVFYNNNLTINQLFYKYILYKYETYQRILLLETDTTFKKNFIDILNKDLQNYNNNFWLYGSYYYGLKKINITKNSRLHINGVCVYNRTSSFKNFIKICSKIQTDINFDYQMFLIMKENELLYKRCINSAYILNISSVEDKDIKEYYIYKKKACLIHTKNAFLLKNII